LNNLAEQRQIETVHLDLGVDAKARPLLTLTRNVPNGQSRDSGKIGLRDGRYNLLERKLFRHGTGG
jgi:hypothetical protein